ncbi:hypothetical protein B0H15DRAFT_1024426 [Mycena belliarum]|uniref:Uncharacterized protein n=1 Tax=Mycena belliarum TaxID=1033014 RepID=A0AAD6XNR5_9AGAR|nr:hypothetical protein B0H15DRAFT_1024426 [Mycena belliae]
MIGIRAFAVQGRLFPQFSVRCLSRQAGHTEPPRPRRFRAENHLTSTLNPSLIIPADYMDVSGRRQFVFYSGLTTGAGDSEGRRLALNYVRQKGRYIQFPDNTHGFLYYKSHPHNTSLAGSVRFRVTHDNAPSSFAHGHDLLTPSGAPWQVILPQIAYRPRFASVAAQLLRDCLVTKDLLSRCRDVFRERTHIHRNFNIVFTFNSTFLVHFSHDVRCSFARDTVHPLLMKHLFTTRTGGERYHPWTGSALARFEASMLPEYAGRRMIHLRFIKIVEPVSPLVDLKTNRGRMQRPQEGELFTVSRYRGLPKPWAYDIDAEKSKPAAVLRQLWDVSTSAGTSL